MAEESYSFTTARTRLEEIVTQVRKKDTSLEKSLDLLEEGVRLANACTEQIDHADWAPAAAVAEGGEAAAAGEGDEVAAAEASEIVVDGGIIIQDTQLVGDDGEVVGEVIEVVEFEEVREFVDADEAWPEDFAEDALEPADPSADER